MKQSRFSEQPIAFILQQAEQGVAVEDRARAMLHQIRGPYPVQIGVPFR